MKLSLEQNAYFDTMATLFMSEGWRLFMDDVQGWQDALGTQYDTVDDIRKLGVVQGRKMMAQQILTYQELIEETKKGLEDAPEPDLEQEDATTV